MNSIASKTIDRTLVNLRRRLERLELLHLRQHALELHEQLEQANQQLEQARKDAWRADENAEYWRESYMQLQEAFNDEDFATHRVIGLTKDGALLVVQNDQGAH